MVLGIIAAIAAGVLILTIALLTVSEIKKAKKRENSKMCVASVRHLRQKGKAYSMEELERNDAFNKISDESVLMAEVDEQSGEIIGKITAARKADEIITQYLDDNEGILIFE